MAGQYQGGPQRRWIRVQPKANPADQIVLRQVPSEMVTEVDGPAWTQICQNGNPDLAFSITLANYDPDLLNAMSCLDVRLRTIQNLTPPQTDLSPQERSMIDSQTQAEAEFRASLPPIISYTPLPDPETELIKSIRVEYRTFLVNQLIGRIIGKVLEMRSSGLNPFNPDLSICGFRASILSSDDEELNMQVETAVQTDLLAVKLINSRSNQSYLTLHSQGGKLSLKQEGEQMRSHSQAVQTINMLISLVSDLPVDMLDRLNMFTLERRINKLLNLTSADSF